MRGLDDLEGDAPEGDALAGNRLEGGGAPEEEPIEVSLAPTRDPSVCAFDGECAEGRCMEEVGTCEPCPEDMRLVRFATGDAFCIDAHEVSRSDYAAFLQTPSEPAPVAALRDPETCTSKSDFVPGDGTDCRGAFQSEQSPSLPVTCVDLCDAMAYCSSKGRRVCGGPSGIKIGPRRVDKGGDEWHAACSALDESAFPYGDTFAPLCNVASAALVAVDARDECATPSGITQLSGNVAEWVLQCRPSADGEECLVRGGEFRTQDLSTVGCWLPATGVDGTVPPMVLAPLDRSPGVGIRCCSD